MRMADRPWSMAVGALVAVALVVGMTGGMVMAADGEEEGVAAPDRIDQRVAVYGYLVWLWSLIAILAYVLVLKIREAARVRAMGYTAGKTQKSRPTRDE